MPVFNCIPKYTQIDHTKVPLRIILYTFQDVSRCPFFYGPSHLFSPWGSGFVN